MNKIIISIIGIFVMAGLVYALATFTAAGGGLVGHWALDAESYDSNTERITDKTPYENHGTNNGSILTTDRMGQSNRAMYFDGKTARDRISFGSFTIGTTGTYNLWIKGDKTAGVQRSENIYPLGIQMKHSLLGPSGGVTGRYGLITNDGTNRYYDWGNQDVYDNEWHMYTVAWDGTYVYAWLDGVSVGAPKAHSGQIFSGTGNFYAGAGWSSTYGTHTGELGEVRLYDQVLSIDEIATLYHSYRPKLSSGSLQKGLIGHWALDGESYDSNTERITDKTPYENHGTNNGSILTTDRMGQSNRAMSFDGVDDKITVFDDASLKINESMTLAFWIYPKNLGNGRQNPLDKSYGGEFALTLEDDPDAGLMSYYHGTQRSPGYYWSWSAINTGTLQDNQWQFVAITRNVSDRNMTSYYNGQSHKSALYDSNVSKKPSPSSYNVLIGDGYSKNFNGSISDVRIYNHALSADEIDTLYHSYRPKAASGSLQKGLVLDMPLTSKYTKDETVGSEIMTDRTPYSNDGQNYGATVGSNGTSFDGVDDYVEVPNHISLNPTIEYSVALWMLAGTPKQWSGLVGKHPYANGYLIYRGGTYGTPIGLPYVDGIRKDVSSGFSPTQGEWYHIVFTVKQEDATRIYVNGQLKGTTYIPTGVVNTNTNPLRIAGQGGGGPPIWDDGTISDVRIYNRALSESEIKLLYDKGR